MFLASASKSFSYSVATRVVAHLAQGLDAARVRRFLVYMRDCPELILLLMAGSVVGAQTCVANRRYSTDEIADLCRRFGFEHVMADVPMSIDNVRSHYLSDMVPPKEFNMNSMAIPRLSDDPDARHIVLTTGTTGTPKGAVYAWRDLVAQIRQRPDQRSVTFLLAYQMNHFAGIQMMLHALCNRAALVMAESLQMPDVAWAAKNFNVDAISATPTFWRMLCSYVASHSDRLSLKQVTVGGEAVTDDLLAKLETCFPGVPVAQVYASTEMGSTFSVRDGKAGFPVSLLNRNSGEVQLRVVDGELQIRAQHSMLGYVGDSSSTQGEWFATGDLVAIQGDRVVFLGRKSEVINVGGVKVHPVEIEKVINQVPGVFAVRVSGRPNPVTGQIVVAQVVIAPDSNGKEEEMGAAIRSACKVLDRYMQPRLIEFVSNLPTANQKLMRRPESES